MVSEKFGLGKDFGVQRFNSAKDLERGMHPERFARSLDEVTQVLDCEVENLLIENTSQHSYVGEMRIGGSNSTQETGYTVRTTLDVHVFGARKIKRIIFNGYCFPIQTGDSIEASFLIADIKQSFAESERTSGPKHFIPREMRAEEMAYQLVRKVVSNDGAAGKLTARSVEYDMLKRIDEAYNKKSRVKSDGF